MLLRDQSLSSPPINWMEKIIVKAQALKLLNSTKTIAVAQWNKVPYGALDESPLFREIVKFKGGWKTLKVLPHS